MIRLMVIGPAGLPWRDIARRPRGAVICDDGVAASMQAWDAALAFAIPDDDGLSFERLLDGRKHVLVPIDIDLPFAQLQALADRAKQVNVRFAVVNPDRYLPSRQLIRHQLDAGKLGEPGLIRIHRWRSAGALLRDLDLVLWYFGKAPNLVYAVSHVGGGNTQIHLGFPGGGMALLDHAAGLPVGAGYYSLSLIGSTGAAYADDHQNMQLAYQGGLPRAVHADEGTLPIAVLVQEFVDAIAAGRDAAEDWRQVFAIRAAIEQSIATRQAVTL
ncbi:MAG: hypothetical protein EXR98_22705 [Gemmataceae bacterium]|nr:hypothetical protein [Gemmataceae bacterium]